MTAVHGQDEVEAFEVAGGHLSRAQCRQVVAANGRVPAAARVRRIAHVVVVGAGGLHVDAALQAGLLHGMPQDALGGGAAADVAGADHQDGKLDHGID